jgi:hypothetical protein
MRPQIQDDSNPISYFSKIAPRARRRWAKPGLRARDWNFPAGERLPQMNFLEHNEHIVDTCSIVKRRKD